MGIDAGWVSERDHTEPDPDKALALAVIQRAILDHVAPAADLTFADKRDAELFLFAKDGAWAASRRAWCSVADIEEAWLRRRVRAIIAGEAQIETSGNRPRSVRRGPKPRGHQESPIAARDREMMDYLRSKGHLPGLKSSDKAGTARILTNAGFRAPRGGPITRDTAHYFIERNWGAFS